MSNYQDKGRSYCDPCGILCIIFIYISLIYSNYAFLTYVIFFNDTSLLRFFAALLYQVLIFFVFWSHTKASYCDPGVVQKPTHNLDFSGDRLLTDNESNDLDKTNNWTICSKCETYRPPKAHHCRICQRCIIKMDHHCPWINNCVSASNQKYFLQFLFYVCSLCFVTLLSIFFEFLDINNANQSHVRAIHCIILLIESLLFGIFVIAVFTDQLHVLRNNKSSIDRFKNTRRKKVQNSIKSNSFKKVCGKGPIFLWLLPINLQNSKRFDHFIV